MQLDLKIIVQYFFICFFILDFRLKHKVPTQPFTSAIKYLFWRVPTRHTQTLVYSPSQLQHCHPSQTQNSGRNPQFQEIYPIYFLGNIFYTKAREMEKDSLSFLSKDSNNYSASRICSNLVKFQSNRLYSVPFTNKQTKRARTLPPVAGCIICPALPV